MREILQKQIREKDAMIDTLLQQLNPKPSLCTPLTLVPSRLALTDSQRAAYHDVLSWFEKVQSGARVDGKEKIDVSLLEDGYDEGLDSDNEGNSPDVHDNLPAPQPHLLPGGSAPAGLLASAALDSDSAIASPPSPEMSLKQEEETQDLKVEKGIGSKTYFQPGEFLQLMEDATIIYIALSGPSANLDLRRLIIERQAAPEIILSGLVSYEDIPILFDL